MTTEPASYPHLDQKAKEKLKLSDEDRIMAIRTGTWLALDHVKKALAKMEILRVHPMVTRMPCMLLVGPAFSGKTSIVEHFRDLHLPSTDPEAEVVRAEVVMVDAPPRPDLPDLYSRILSALMAPYKPTAPVHEKQRQIVHLFAALGVRVLIIDEIHNLLAGTPVRQRVFLNALKSLGNETKVCVVAVGTEEAYTAFATDPQMSSRYVPFDLPQWLPGEELGVLLATLEKRTPLHKPSGLHLPEMMWAIHGRSESNLGDIFDLVKEAAIHAILTKGECITEALLASMDWVPPSKRKNYRHRV